MSLPLSSTLFSWLLRCVIWNMTHQLWEWRKSFLWKPIKQNVKNWFRCDPNQTQFPCTLCAFSMFAVLKTSNCYFVDISKVFANMTYSSNLWYWKLYRTVTVKFLMYTFVNWISQEKVKKSKAFCLYNKFLEQLHIHLFDVCFFLLFVVFPAQNFLEDFTNIVQYEVFSYAFVLVEFSLARNWQYETIQ